LNKIIVTSEQVVFFEEESEIITVVGSSLAVTLYDRVKEIGGLLHFLEPKWNGIGVKSCRYGDIGTEELIEKFLKSGSKKEDIVANIVGGAIIGEYSDDLPIGLKNVKSAKDTLGKFGIAIDTVDVGKELGRFLSFNSKSGILNIRKR
jgi:chemotaxis protein CheD